MNTETHKGSTDKDAAKATDVTVSPAGRTSSPPQSGPAPSADMDVVGFDARKAGDPALQQGPNGFSNKFVRRPGMPEDLSHVHSVLVDGKWHAIRPGSLETEGDSLSFGDPTNPEHLQTVIQTSHVRAYLVDGVKVKASKEAKLKSLREVKAGGYEAPPEPNPEAPPGHEPIVPGVTEATQDEHGHKSQKHLKR